MDVLDGQHSVVLNELTIAPRRLGLRYDVTPPWPDSVDMMPTALPSISVQDDQGTEYWNSNATYRTVFDSRFPGADSRVVGLVTCQPAPPESVQTLTMTLTFEIARKQHACEFVVELADTSDPNVPDNTPIYPPAPREGDATGAEPDVAGR